MTTLDRHPVRRDVSPVPRGIPPFRQLFRYFCEFCLSCFVVLFALFFFFDKEASYCFTECYNTCFDVT